MDDIDITIGVPAPRPGGESPSRGEWSKPSTIWQPPSPEELQRQISAYKIFEMLGRGGMGAVYKGWQVSLERYVAIKILPPNLDGEDYQFAERFKREAKTMAKLHHPGIISVHDAGETASGLLYIVMEFVEGTDVAQMVKSEGRLSAEYALAITAHVCDALQYAHTHGVVHRDIKPANIMVNMEGQVKVADFGLAKANEAAQHGLTRTGLTMGTPDYVAPEALITGIVADHRADLYAVGVMLYDMLTGEIPRGRFLPPSERVGTDPRFDQIIDRAMQTDREHRYQSALEIRQDLDRILTTPLEERSPRNGFTPELSMLREPAGQNSGAEAEPAVVSVRSPLRSKGRARAKAKPWLVPAVVAGVAALGMGGYLLRPGATTGDSPQSATKERPFANTLGMKFVPVPGTKVLFCIHDTRKRDYRKYAEADSRVTDQWMNVKEHGVPVSDGEDHPVVNVNWEEAKGFCAWLSRKEGRTYRLPTDHEWSCAVGIGDREDPEASPESKSGKLKDVYPWGTQWPPPAGAGNFPDRTLKEKIPSWEHPIIEGYEDGYATTSPVMSFKANPFGLYDMSGNVWQWCEDKINSNEDKRVLRGGSWRYDGRDSLLSSCRGSFGPSGRGDDGGFRVVVER